MPSNTRGKIKEQLEGIHRNTEAIKSHLAKGKELVGDKHPAVTSSFNALDKINEMLDESVQRLYSNI